MKINKPDYSSDNLIKLAEVLTSLTRRDYGETENGRTAISLLAKAMKELNDIRLLETKDEL